MGVPEVRIRGRSDGPGGAAPPAPPLPRGARPAARGRGLASPLLLSVLLHAVVISSAWWAFRSAWTPPEIRLTSLAATVASQASEGETTPPEEALLPPLPVVVPPPDLLPEPPRDAEEVPLPDLPPREAALSGPGAAPPPAAPPEARTAPRLTRVPPPVVRPPAPPVPARARTVESVAFAEVEGAVPFGTNAPPVFPPEAAARGWRGSVEVRLLVDEAGMVREASVRRSAGRQVFDDAALEAVRRWRFTPGRRGGVPTAMYVNLTIRFE